MRKTREVKCALCPTQVTQVADEDGFYEDLPLCDEHQAAKVESDLVTAILNGEMDHTIPELDGEEEAA